MHTTLFKDDNKNKYIGISCHTAIQYIYSFTLRRPPCIMLEPERPRCQCDAALERTRGRKEEGEEALEHIASHALTFRLQGLTSQEPTVRDGRDNGHSMSHDAPFQTGRVSTTAADDLPSHNGN